ncbi:MAG: glutamine amidotransferase [Planctomycetota bacterium]|nr:glutamine amidotransferase [Planctomycetota bacterium]
MESWSLGPIFGSFSIVLLIGLSLLILILLVRPYRALSRRRRLTLLFLRFSVIVVLTVVMLRPARTISETQTRPASIIVLTDETQSMLEPSAVDDINRWEHQNRVSKNTASFFLDRKQVVEPMWYGYTNHISAQRWDADNGVPELQEPTGESTDLGASIYEAVSSQPGVQVHAVVLMGDGRQTAYRGDVDIRQAMNELRRRGVPLIGVPFGREGDVLQSKDVAIEQLPQQFRVFSGNDVQVNAITRLRGVLGAPIQVQLKLTPQGGETKVVQTLEVAANEANDIQPVEFTLTAADPGVYMLEVVAESAEGEILLANNRQTAYLTVLEGGLRVLYLYGNRLGEQLEMRRSLASSPDIELTESYIRHFSSRNWPDPRTNILADQDFDVLLIEDVHAAAIGKENLEAVAKAVEDGKGLMMLGGYYSFGPGAYRESPLAPVLPIEMEVFERQEVGADLPVRKVFHIDREIRMSPTMAHPLTTLGNKDQIWQQLPALRGANLFQGVKSSGQVLLESRQEEPLLVTSQYGLGRVVAFAADSTWQWARSGYGDTLRRFWRQNILWLARRENLRQRDVWLKLDQRRFVPGSEIAFEAGVDVLGSEELAPDSLDWTVTLVQEDVVRSIPVARRGGLWSGAIAELDSPGEYQLIAEVKQNEVSFGQARVNFQIVDIQPERNNPLADFQQLTRMAEMTAEQGGKVVAPDQLNATLQGIIDEASQQEVEIKVSWQLGSTSGSAWFLMTLISLLLTLDWMLRKKWGLV